MAWRGSTVCCGGPCVLLGLYQSSSDCKDTAELAHASRAVSELRLAGHSSMQRACKVYVCYSAGGLLQTGFRQLILYHIPLRLRSGMI
jgi:hypothetical protein